MKHLRLLAFSSLSVLAMYGGLVACGDDTVITDPPDAEAGVDTGKDSGQEDVDAGRTEAGPPVNVSVDSIAAVACSSLARCCYLNADAGNGQAVDGGSYDQTGCINFFRSIGGFERSAFAYGSVDAGNVTTDNAKLNECIDKIRALSCNTPGPELVAARNACFAAFTGKLAVGAPCKAAIECGAGQFCSYNDAGTGGTCAALRGDGGACGDYTLYEPNNDLVIYTAEEGCSYRGGGNTGLKCTSYDFGGDVYPPRANWRCEPTVPNGGRCNFSNWCTDGICDGDPTYVCQSSLFYFSSYCDQFAN